MIPTINKPAKVTKTTTTTTDIDHVLTNYFVKNFLKTAIFKTDIYDHFPIYFLFPSHVISNLKETNYLYYRKLIAEPADKFKHSLRETNWDKVIFTKLQAMLKQKFQT